MQCRELFNWKTKKLGAGVQFIRRAANGLPTKKFKVNLTKMKYGDIQRKTVNCYNIPKVIHCRFP